MSRFHYFACFLIISIFLPRIHVQISVTTRNMHWSDPQGPFDRTESALRTWSKHNCDCIVDHAGQRDVRGEGFQPLGCLPLFVSTLRGHLSATSFGSLSVSDGWQLSTPQSRALNGARAGRSEGASQVNSPRVAQCLLVGPYIGALLNPHQCFSPLPELPGAEGHVCGDHIKARTRCAERSRNLSILPRADRRLWR